MSSGSVLIPGIRKARAWKKRVKTMMTELSLFKQLGRTIGTEKMF